MKINKIIWIAVGIIVLILLFLGLKKCTSGKQLVDVVVPEKSGYFNVPPIYIGKEAKKDSIVIKYRTLKKDSVIFVDSVIYTENPVNKQLVKQYTATKDSLEKLKLYLKAIEEKEGTSVFDNDDLKLEVYTKTRGELLDIKPTYTIKERKTTVSVPVKEQVFAMYAGGEVIGTTELNKLGFKADIGLQNKKGNILTLGIDDNKNYYLGIKFRLFGIKK